MRYNLLGAFEGGDVKTSWIILGILTVLCSCGCWFLLGVTSTKNIQNNGPIPYAIMAVVVTALGLTLVFASGRGRSAREDDLDEQAIYAKLSEVVYGGKRYAVLVNLGNSKVKFYEVSEPLPDAQYIRRVYPGQGDGEYIYVPYEKK